MHEFDEVEVLDGYITLKSFPMERECLYVLCPYGIGDTLYVASLMMSYKMHNQENRPIYLIVKDSHKDIPFWFAGVDGRIAATPIVDYLNLYCIVTQQWCFKNLIYGHFKKSANGSIDPAYHEIAEKTILSRYRKLVLSLPDTCTTETAKFPWSNVSKWREQYKVNDKSVLLMPYAFSCPQLPMIFWEALAKALMAAGYQVFTNVKDESEQPLSQTCPISESIENMALFAENVSAVIGLRSGLCDVMALIHTKLIIINPDLYRQNEWNVCDVTDRKDIYNFLCDDIKKMPIVLRQILLMFDIVV